MGQSTTALGNVKNQENSNKKLRSFNPAKVFSFPKVGVGLRSWITVSLSKAEKISLFLSFIMLSSLMFFVVTIKTSEMNAQHNLDDAVNRSSKCISKGSLLKQEINQLGSKDHINKLVKPEGLNFNNSNIRDIRK